jgi:hypothetical protein
MDDYTPNTLSHYSLPTAGGGASVNALEWVELSLDPNDASWTLLKNGNANNPDCTLTNDGTNMVASMPTARDYGLDSAGGVVNNGMSLISSAHINPWANFSSGSPPAGVPVQQVQPEAMVIKLEVQFDHPNGPWNAPGTGFGYEMICCAGFVSYQNDQGGSPGFPGWMYRGAQVRKTHNANPGTSTGNMYRGGYKSHVGKGDVDGAIFCNQQNATSTSHDAIVFELGIQLRRNNSTGTNWTPCGTYATTDPFGSMLMSGYGFQDAATVYSDPTTTANYFHFWLYFGSNSGSRAGTSKIQRIRYCIQPVASRVSI